MNGAKREGNGSLLVFGCSRREGVGLGRRASLLFLGQGARKEVDPSVVMGGGGGRGTKEPNYLPDNDRRPGTI